MADQGKSKRYPNLSKSQFALPKKRKYPINTKKRARAALSYGARYASEADQKKIRQAVAQKYPSIDVSGIKTNGKKQ